MEERAHQQEIEGADEMFPRPPKTRVEMAEEFLEHFQADVDKAETSLVNARKKLREAEELRDDAEKNLARAMAAPEEEVES